MWFDRIRKAYKKLAAQHGVAADRFAQDRWFFEAILCRALAAAERQAVGQQLAHAIPDEKLLEPPSIKVYGTGIVDIAATCRRWFDPGKLSPWLTAAERASSPATSAHAPAQRQRELHDRLGNVYLHQMS